MEKISYETLLYSITSNVVQKIIDKYGWSENIAMERFVESKLYSYLEREETKVWQYSATMLATLFDEEREGRISLPDM